MSDTPTFAPRGSQLDERPRTGTILVSIQGSDGVDTDFRSSEENAGALLLRVAKLLGVPLDLNQVGIVVNGQQRTADAAVEPGDVVAAAPRAANG
jgi:hypothetical protein